MSHVVTGVDADGILKLSITVTGEVPEVYADDEIGFSDYDENYIQTGPGQIYAFSSRTYTINGKPIPYAWKHTIEYDPTGKSMPFLVQTLKSRRVRVDFNSLEQMMEYGVRVSIVEGKTFVDLF